MSEYIARVVEFRFGIPKVAHSVTVHKNPKRGAGESSFQAFCSRSDARLGQHTAMIGTPEAFHRLPFFFGYAETPIPDDDPTLEHVAHESVSAFYAYIGFDNKKRRFRMHEGSYLAKLTTKPVALLDESSLTALPRIHKYVYEYRLGEFYRIHRINISHTQYRQRELSSLGAFSFRMGARLRRHSSSVPPFHFDLIEGDFVDSATGLENPAAFKLPMDLPLDPLPKRNAIKTHNGVFRFYTTIGYNYRKNGFSSALGSYLHDAFNTTARNP